MSLRGQISHKTLYTCHRFALELLEDHSFLVSSTQNPPQTIAPKRAGRNNESADCQTSDWFNEPPAFRARICCSTPHTCSSARRRKRRALPQLATDHSDTYQRTRRDRSV